VSSSITSAQPGAAARGRVEADILTVVSYNLWQARAQRELPALVRQVDPDVLCVQEADASALVDRLGELGLASVTPRNRLGVAVFVRSARFDVERASTFHLTRSLHDRLIGGAERRLAAARVVDRRTGRGIVLGSFHGAPFTDLNSVRRQQVDDAHEALAHLGPGLPTMMAGDYNHPIFLDALRRHVEPRGFTLARTADSTYRGRGNLMRGPFDLATVSQLAVVDAATLPRGRSDHRPVLFTLTYADASALPNR
jgi:exodeoxyribonuclease III